MKIILFSSFAVVFAAWVIPMYCGGAMRTLSIREGHYYLQDHGKVTEVAPRVMLWLGVLTGAGVVALFACIFARIALRFGVFRDAQK